MEGHTLSRGQFVGKFALLLADYVIVVIALEALMRLGLQGESVSKVLAASYAFALFLIPNALSFTISAFIMRRRWVELRAPQILAVGMFAAVITAFLIFFFGFLLGSVYSMSETGAKVIIRTVMFLP